MNIIGNYKQITIFYFVIVLLNILLFGSSINMLLSLVQYIIVIKCILAKQYEVQLESKEVVDVDGTVDLTGASMYILDRRYEWQQCYDMNLLEYFMNIAREHTKSFCTWGRNWPEMRERKPEWFGKAE